MSTIAPPEQRTITAKMRWDPATRAKGDRTISGYASVFNSESEDLGFRETIAPGAFKRSLSKPGADFWLLWGHDHLEPLARTSAGTLDLREDHKGLKVSAELVDTTTGRDVHALVKAGLVRSMSFGFYVKADQWETRNGVDHRLVTEAELIEVSVVPVPAYESTEVSVRASQATLDRIERVTGARPRLALRERGPYGPDSKFSWFRDRAVVDQARLALRDQALTIVNRGEPKLADMPSVLESPVHGGVKDALARLATVEGAESRDIGTAGWLTPVAAPFIGELFSTAAHQFAVIPASLRQEVLPTGGMTVRIPRILGAATAAVQTENAAASETDVTTTESQAPVQTVAGLQDVAQQALDQSPGGALDAAIALELGKAVGEKMSQTIITALIAAAGTNVAYVDATPTPAEAYSKYADLRQKVHVAMGTPGTLVAMHPRRRSFFDTTLVPLRFPETIVESASVPVTLGGGAEDVLFVIVIDYVALLSRPPTIISTVEPLSANLTVRYVASVMFALGVRNPLAIGTLTGSGMTTPAL
jgi:HK97 family phage prohead protease